MARQNLIDDKAAQICWRYLHGEFDEKTNASIHDIVHYNTDKRIAITMVLEIAYRIGYAKSSLLEDMTESTYKRKKKSTRDKLVAAIKL